MRRRFHQWLAPGLCVVALTSAHPTFAQNPASQATPQSVPVLPGDVGAPSPGAGTGAGIPGQGGAAPASAGTPENANGSDSAADGTSPLTQPGADPAGTGVLNEGPDVTAFTGLGGTVGDTGNGFFGMIGDGSPTSRVRTFARPGNVPSPPGIPNPGVPPTPPRIPRVGTNAVAILPSIQQLKISENQSPRPQDRIYFSFNSFNDVNGTLNDRFGSQFSGVNIYRYVLGLEKTFFEGRGSAGLRIPIHNLSSQSTLPGFGGTSTSAGDLAAIFKYAFWDDRDAGNLMSAGLMVSMPTGPGNFAGAKGFVSPRNTALTPFIGYVFSRGDFYLQGFTSLEVPLDQNEATILYNDLGVGYFVYKAAEPGQFLSAIAPTFEVHVNTPLNNRGFYNIQDLTTNTYDAVNLTSGCNFILGGRGVLTLGVVTPVTGPRPFDIESVAQFNLRF